MPVMFARDYLSQAVSAESHTALAWPGLGLLLPVSIKLFVYYSLLSLHSDCSRCLDMRGVQLNAAVLSK